MIRQLRYLQISTTREPLPDAIISVIVNRCAPNLPKQLTSDHHKVFATGVRLSDEEHAGKIPVLDDESHYQNCDQIRLSNTTRPGQCQIELVRYTTGPLLELTQFDGLLLSGNFKLIQRIVLNHPSLRSIANCFRTFPLTPGCSSARVTSSGLMTSAETVSAFRYCSGFNASGNWKVIATLFSTTVAVPLPESL